MAKRVMTVIPAIVDLSKRTVLVVGPDVTGPLMVGKGDGAGPDDWLCGNCGRILLATLSAAQFSKIVIQCSCGTSNSVDDTSSPH